MQETTINGISCYGTPSIGMNYEITFHDEFMDYTSTIIEATSWKQVIKQLSAVSDISKVEQIIAC